MSRHLISHVNTKNIALAGNEAAQEFRAALELLTERNPEMAKKAAKLAQRLAKLQVNFEKLTQSVGSQPTRSFSAVKANPTEFRELLAKEFKRRYDSNGYLMKVDGVSFSDDKVVFTIREDLLTSARTHQIKTILEGFMENDYSEVRYTIEVDYPANY
jgi:hypothetical protein